MPTDPHLSEEFLRRVSQDAHRLLVPTDRGRGVVDLLVAEIRWQRDEIDRQAKEIELLLDTLLGLVTLHHADAKDPTLIASDALRDVADAIQLLVKYGRCDILPDRCYGRMVTARVRSCTERNMEDNDVT